MPMFPEYSKPIETAMAEVKNSGGRTEGVSTSAKFIEHFTEGYPWAMRHSWRGTAWSCSGC